MNPQKQYIEHIHECMWSHFLHSNRKKTEVVIFGPKEEQLLVISQLHCLPIRPENLGVVMDPHLNIRRRIKTITKSAFYQLKNMSRMKGLMSQQDLDKFIHAFDSSLTRQHFHRSANRQLIQKAAAQVLTKKSRPHHPCSEVFSLTP